MAVQPLQSLIDLLSAKLVFTHRLGRSFGTQEEIAIVRVKNGRSKLWLVHSNRPYCSHSFESSQEIIDWLTNEWKTDMKFPCRECVNKPLLCSAQ